jgi:hypothetical protein
MVGAMTSIIERAAAEIEKELQPLPDGFCVKADTATNTVVVGSNEMSFRITRENIDESLHLEIAKTTFPHLLSAIAEGHAIIAASLSLETLLRIADNLRPHLSALH